MAPSWWQYREGELQRKKDQASQSFQGKAMGWGAPERSDPFFSGAQPSCIAASRSNKPIWVTAGGIMASGHSKALALCLPNVHGRGEGVKTL